MSSPAPSRSATSASRAATSASRAATSASRAATLGDVASEAGVSLATASRVLNGSRPVAHEYRRRVEEAAERLGYIANLSAQTTARGTSPVVALLVADIADPYFGQLAAGVTRAAESAGLITTIAITDRDAERELSLVRTLRGQRPRGIILATSRDTSVDPSALARELEAATAHGARIVTLGAGVAGSQVVPIDNLAGAEALGTAVAELGYRDAVIIAAREGVRTSDDRIAGFSAGFEAGGGAAPRVVRAGITRDAGYEAAATLLEAGLEPGTLLFGVSDVVAIGALSAVRDAGLVPGDDIAIAGFDDIAAGRDIVPGITTVSVPLEALGAQALEAAISDDWGGAAALPLEVRLRASTPRRA
ncbi:LacI family DNA-binding transcriptional regulator [Microbacterium stercoris]|uniref:LacI family DNA-binding transcriptional regulator n=1 Tax=Microbacterium stercoris TaxID=2820289 RepID=A0A939QPL9_9MICO|nr:LacI family DNA-binding transcriptional regulator [Microbacterium stercoris]MBO3662633.1 LacI family DNA-binding transcriptional regulator [Microbacterium stercoris]